LIREALETGISLIEAKKHCGALNDSFISIRVSSIQPGAGWFTIAPMLQDLDSLAARIGQMVQLTRELQAESTVLRARLKSAEQERGALRDQLDRRESEYQSMARRIEQHESELEAVRAQGLSAQEECATARQNLQFALAEAARLRTAAESAKDRIDMVLMRLPGASAE
jgi:chromosome segregation ATPase